MGGTSKILRCRSATVITEVMLLYRRSFDVIKITVTTITVIERSLELKMQHNHRPADVKGPLGMRTTPLQPPPPHTQAGLNFFHFMLFSTKSLQNEKVFAPNSGSGEPFPHLGKTGSPLKMSLHIESRFIHIV